MSLERKIPALLLTATLGLGAAKSTAQKLDLVRGTIRNAQPQILEGKFLLGRPYKNRKHAGYDSS